MVTAVGVAVFGCVARPMREICSPWMRMTIPFEVIIMRLSSPVTIRAATSGPVLSVTFIAILMTIGGLASFGLPATSGFIAEFLCFYGMWLAYPALAMLSAVGIVLTAIYVLRVPNQLSLDAGLEEEERLGLSVLESARLAGRKSGLKVQTRLIRTRNPGAAIVEEAERVGAEIIYLGTAHAPPSERALGPTANYLLAHRPCRVVIETAPAG